MDTLEAVVVPEMAHDVIESSEFLWITRIVDIICLLIIAFIFIYHSYIIIKFKHKSIRDSRSKSVFSRSLSSALAKWTDTLNTLTLLYILSQFLMLLMLTLNIWQSIPTSWSCSMVVKIITALYHISKALFYYILITRLQVVHDLAPQIFSQLFPA